MKKLIFLIALAIVGTFSMAFAQHNIPYDKSGGVSATVITPFSIVDATPNANPFLCSVIKGQVRLLEPTTNGSVILFHMMKESGYTVLLSLSLPNPVSNVTLTSQWYFTDKEPPTTFTWPIPASTAIDQSFNWYDVQSEGWIFLNVSQVDASNSLVTVGTKTFQANVTGQYSGL